MQTGLQPTTTLSWPKLTGSGIWILILLFGGVFGFIAGGFGMVAAFVLGPRWFDSLNLDMNGFSTLLALFICILPFVVLGSTTVGVMAGMWFVVGKPFRDADNKAKEERKKTANALGAIAIGEASGCGLKSAVLVLTRDSFAVYDRLTFAKKFGCPLSAITDAKTETRTERAGWTQQNPDTGAEEDVGVTWTVLALTINQKGIVDFRDAIDLNLEQWAGAINSVRRGVAIP